ncbi:MAG: hypothetical protein Q8O76_14475 [Chloroflexota bacterium]|nr:hypothetical protein [Chloroflexota bacterium]
MVFLVLADGTKVAIEADSITRQQVEEIVRRLTDGWKLNVPTPRDAAETLTIAQQLFDIWGLRGPRISRKLMYKVEPARWSDCPHFEVGEEKNMLAQVEVEDQAAATRGQRDARA